MGVVLSIRGEGRKKRKKKKKEKKKKKRPPVDKSDGKTTLFAGVKESQICEAYENYESESGLITSFLTDDQKCRMTFHFTV